MSVSRLEKAETRTARPSGVIPSIPRTPFRNSGSRANSAVASKLCVLPPHRLLQAVDTLVAVAGQALKDLKRGHAVGDMRLIEEELPIKLRQITDLCDGLGPVARENVDLRGVLCCLSEGAGMIRTER